MLQTRTLQGTVTVDDVDYDWSLQREPQWSTDQGYKGMAVAVQLAASPARQAVLEFPFPRWSARKSTPHRQRPQVQRAQLEEGIRAALAAGWDPASKGKPFTVEL
jgi:hypothetical protein